MKRFNISHKYDVDLWNRGVYNASDDRLSQICAFLNPIRQKVQEALDSESEIKLSPNYVLFYYLTDLAEETLTYARIFKDEKKALDDLEVSLNRLFNIEDFKRIVQKHGLVPINAMPDSAHHHKSDCVYVFENRLRLGVVQFINDTEDIEKIKSDIASILTEGLGEIPEAFPFAYIGRGGELKTLEETDGIGFYEKYCGTDITAYETASVNKKTKSAVTEMIKNGEQVVVLADTRHQSNQMLGILDTDFIDENDLFGADYSLTKKEKLKYGIIKPRAYLSLDGVSLGRNGEPLRFKAQDSHGSDTGADGHYTMSDKWFDEYVVSAIVNKKYLN